MAPFSHSVIESLLQAPSGPLLCFLQPFLHKSLLADFLLKNMAKIVVDYVSDSPAFVWAEEQLRRGAGSMIRAIERCPPGEDAPLVPEEVHSSRLLKRGPGPEKTEWLTAKNDGVFAGDERLGEDLERWVELHDLECVDQSSSSDQQKRKPLPLPHPCHFPLEGRFPSDPFGFAAFCLLREIQRSWQCMHGSFIHGELFHDLFAVLYESSKEKLFAGARDSVMDAVRGRGLFGSLQKLSLAVDAWYKEHSDQLANHGFVVEKNPTVKNRLGFGGGARADDLMMSFGSGEREDGFGTSFPSRGRRED